MQLHKKHIITTQKCINCVAFCVADIFFYSCLKIEDMANNLTLRFTVNGQSCYKGRLALEIKQKGTSNRAYIPVNNLLNADLTNWNNKNQQFIGRDETTANNNLELQSLLNTVNYLNDNKDFCFNTPKELKDAFITGKTIQAKKVVTFGELIQLVIDKEKTTKQSTNYWLYKTLLNKLTSKDAPKYNCVRITDTPVTEIKDEHFKAFSNWLLEHPTYGYKNLMTNFKAALNRAGDILNIKTNRLTYSFTKNIRKKDNTKRLNAKQKIKAAKNDIATLSKEQIEQFEQFDLTKIAPTQNEFKKNLEIYFDTVLLMYYTLSRPADIIRMRYQDNYDPETKCITYKPYKLRNRNANTVVVKLNDKAINIINKYKGQSKYGYILPLPINRKDWSNKTFDNWEIARKNTIQAINRYLSMIKREMKLDIPRLHMYIFRHSAITNALHSGMNVTTVARWAGTSIEMIDKHYLSNIDNTKNPL